MGALSFKCVGDHETTSTYQAYFAGDRDVVSDELGVSREPTVEDDLPGVHFKANISWLETPRHPEA